ncbi:hypothetical protein [Streptomyces sp. NPDC058108]|uniref:hypothetical protein n=1 Tax=Streptomyces sp. NPDC058108 TaxID=3346344 RepID=UPI0036E1EA42
MHHNLPAIEIARALAAGTHTDATRGTAWRPGYRAVQASPATVRLWHDGPDETDHLDQYTETLRTAGYTATVERPAGKRPSLRISRQAGGGPR